jgi:tetratricopeptide (TPR) repeat protein
MRLVSRNRILCAVCIGLACSVTLAQQRVDQVFPVRGAPVAGSIVSVSPTEVVIRSRGADQRISVLDIKRISLADDPRELATARDSILNGQFESGRDQLKRIDGSSINQELVKQDLDFYLALALAKVALTGGGDKEEAAQAMMNFARGAPKSHHFVEAAETLGELAVAREKYDEAARYYAFLTKTAQEASWTEYELRIGVLEGRALESQGKHAEATTRYDAVIGAAQDSAQANEQKKFARVGKATALAEQGKTEEGLKLVEEIIQQNDAENTELFGRAYNAMGRCYLKSNKPKEALLAYQHTDSLFHQHPEVHAEALFHLSKLWTTVNKSDRAAAARSQLTERYAGSPWAKRN